MTYRNRDFFTMRKRNISQRETTDHGFIDEESEHAWVAGTRIQSFKYPDYCSDLLHQ